MNNFLKIYEWFKQVDGHMLKIETENRSFEIPLSISIIPHLLGLQYVNFPLKRKLNTVDLMEYIKNQQFEDKDIFQMIDKNKRKSVNDRVNTFKYFLENLDKGILVQNTHPKTHIRSEDFIIESKDGKYLHLGLLNVAGLSNIENFEVIDTNIEKYLETYFQDKKDKYFSQSPYQEKIKSIEIRKPQQEQFVPFSFKELKEIDEQSHTIEVAKKKATFSLQQILEKKKEEIKQEEATKSSPIPSKGEVER